VIDIGRHPTTGARRQRTKTGFATRRAAEEALARVVAGIDPILTVGAMTLQEFCRQWLDGHCPTVKATTAKGYRERLEWYVLPRLGHVKLRDLSPLHIQTLWSDLLANGRTRGGGLSAVSVAGVRRVLRKVLNDAVAWELMDRNPVLRVKAPRVESTEMRTWSAQDARRFLDRTATDRLHALLGARHHHRHAPRRARRPALDRHQPRRRAHRPAQHPRRVTTRRARVRAEVPDLTTLGRDRRTRGDRVAQSSTPTARGAARMGRRLSRLRLRLHHRRRQGPATPIASRCCSGDSAKTSAYPPCVCTTSATPPRA
jgi:hypothetical protein